MARLACASLVKYCGGWFSFYSAVTICECQFSVAARYVKKRLPSLREVRNNFATCPHRVLVATLLALGASPAGETPKTLERLRRAMASRHALLHVHASLDPNVAIRFILGWVKLCTIV